MSKTLRQLREAAGITSDKKWAKLAGVTRLCIGNAHRGAVPPAKDLEKLAVSIGKGPEVIAAAVRVSGKQTGQQVLGAGSGDAVQSTTEE